MFSAIFSFLGGAAFRMIWGEISGYLKQRQEHKQQVEMMKLQAELDAGRHTRDLERIRLQADLGVREIQVKGDLAIQKTDAEAFVEAMKNAMKPTGIWFIDAWNGSIRPQFAQFALLMWFAKVIGQGFVLDAYDQELSCAILGFFVADRTLGKRGK